MSINRSELLAVLTVASHMVIADQEVHPSEKQALRAIFKVTHITPSERKWMTQAVSLDSLLEGIHSDEAKDGLINLLALIAGADGEYQIEEREFLQKIMSKFGLTYEPFSFFDEYGTLNVPDVRKHATDIIQIARYLSGDYTDIGNDEKHIDNIVSSPDEKMESEDDISFDDGLDFGFPEEEKK